MHVIRYCDVGLFTRARDLLLSICALNVAYDVYVKYELVLLAVHNIIYRGRDKILDSSKVSTLYCSVCACVEYDCTVNNNNLIN